MRAWIFALTVLVILVPLNVTGQYKLKPVKGYSPQIGLMVWMMEDLKDRITRDVEKMSVEETDFLMDEQANRVGAIIFHLAAIEKYYQVESLGGKYASKEQKEMFDIASDLGDKARERLVGKPISYYLEEWNAVRKETLDLLKEKDDKWFASKGEGGGYNHHWVWYHVMEHQASHMGQILLIAKRNR